MMPEAPRPMTRAEFAAFLLSKGALLDAWQQSGRETTKEWYDQLMYDVPELVREAFWRDAGARTWGCDADLRPPAPAAAGTHARPVRARPDDLLALPAAHHHPEPEANSPRPRRRRSRGLPRTRARILLDQQRRDQRQQDQDGHARHAPRPQAAAPRLVSKDGAQWCVVNEDGPYALRVVVPG